MTDNQTLTLTVAFESDWHIGEGAGALGHIDRIVRRHSEDDLPYVPAKTLTGILRDSCERIAHGLDDGVRDGPWQAFAAELFGRQSQQRGQRATTTHALLRVGPARFPAGLAAALAANREIRAALTFIKPGVRIDKNGLAESGMLRFEEVVLGGAELGAECELDLAGEARAAALALLAAGARAVERLGAKRRRGNGRCSLRFKGEPADLAARLAGPPPAIEEAPRALRLHLAPLQVDDAPGWQIIPLELTLRSPVVVPEATAGNVVATRDHIPGSLLLPALDPHLRTLLGERASQLTALVAAGLIQIRNAYPAGADGQRLLPVPAALMAEKENPGKLRSDLHGEAADHKQRKQLRTGYVPEAGLPATGGQKSPLRVIDAIAITHAVIDDEQQRPNAEVGGLYTYEAIPPGTRLRAEIRIVRSLPLLRAEAWQSTLRIGVAKKDDYGLVDCRAGAPAPAPVDRSDANTREFTLWLVSPLLARDTRLRPITDAETLCTWLQEQLGTPLELGQSFARSLRDDGWNTAWNEPRPTRFGLASGSVLRFKATAGIPAATLARLAAEGLGERRGEGYGEIRIDPPLLAAIEPPTLVVAGKADGAHATATTVPVSSDFTEQLHRRAWRLALRRQVLARAPDEARALGWSKDEPPNSQLGALRSQIENWAGVAPFRDWLQHLKDTDNRADKWPPAALAALDEFAADPASVWQHFETPPCLPGHEPATLRQQMTGEALRIYWLTVIGAEQDRRAAADKARSSQGAQHVA